MKKTRIRTFYPADPLGVVPGGVDTFLRGLFKWAPEDIEFSLVGMTTDQAARPVGHWTTCDLGRRTFKIFPVVAVSKAGGRMRVPLSLRYTSGAWQYRSQTCRDFDVFEFHRVEPALLFTGDARPKNAFFHQDMAVIKTEQQADILWRRFPSVYFGIERLIFGSLSSAWCVREEGAKSLQARYPSLANHISFVPTWVDTEVFSPCTEEARHALRSAFASGHELNAGARWVITVGRLDTQKNPLLMLAAFQRLLQSGVAANWLVVGDGILRSELESAVVTAGLADHVRFLGLQPPNAIANYLRASDVFALSSAYEGMPMAVLEALGCGLPVATTAVGEVRRVVFPGVNGDIAEGHDIGSFAKCLDTVVRNAGAFRGAKSVSAIEAFQPQSVLAPVYQNYRELGALSS